MKNKVHRPLNKYTQAEERKLDYKMPTTSSEVKLSTLTSSFILGNAGVCMKLWNDEEKIMGKTKDK